MSGVSASSQGGVSTAEQGAPDDVAVPIDESTAPEEVSLFERLREEEWLALFNDNHGVYSINEIGNVEYIIPDQHFDWMTLDYGAGLLWLDRAWAKVDPGLFVVNLAAAEPTLIKLTLLHRGVEIRDSGGHILPMTEGDAPYRISMNESPISVVMAPTMGLVCGSECELSDEAIALGHLAQAQYGAWTSPLPLLERLTYPKGEGISIGTILQLPLDGIDLELRAVSLVDHPGSHVWQLYDVAAGEYIRPEYGIRSKRKFPEGAHVQHLMICEGGKGIVVERGFFAPDLTLLARHGNLGMGLCLTGGVLFEDRGGLRH